MTQYMNEEVGLGVRQSCGNDQMRRSQSENLAAAVRWKGICLTKFESSFLSNSWLLGSCCQEGVVNPNFFAILVRGTAHS